MSWISTHFSCSDDFNLYLNTLKSHNYFAWNIHYEQALKSVNNQINDFYQQIQQINTMSLQSKAAITPYQGLSTQWKSSNDFHGIATSHYIDSIINNGNKGIKKNSQEIDKVLKALNNTEERKRKLIEYDRKLKQSKTEWEASQVAQQSQVTQQSHNTQNLQSNDNTQQQMQHLQDKVKQLGDMIMNVQTHILDGDDNDHKDQNDATQELSDWLTDVVGLPQYIDTFIENGFEDLESLENVTMDDLIEIKITKLGHRKKLLAKIQSIQQ
eukprot:255192_1